MTPDEKMYEPNAIFGALSPQALAISSRLGASPISIEEARSLRKPGSLQVISYPALAASPNSMAMPRANAAHIALPLSCIQNRPLSLERSIDGIDVATIFECFVNNNMAKCKFLATASADYCAGVSLRAFSARLLGSVLEEPSTAYVLSDNMGGFEISFQRDLDLIVIAAKDSRTIALDGRPSEFWNSVFRDLYVELNGSDLELLEFFDAEVAQYITGVGRLR